ncbi:reverse transcriptase domain-containing protein, partial [Tanacetum coccineum]
MPSRQLTIDFICIVASQTAAMASASNLTGTPACAEEDIVTFATGTLTNDALSWWNAYAQPMGIEQANQTTWTELKRLLTNKYCPQTEIRKMEDELYHLSVKGNDLKPYVRRFQELTTLCPNMVPNNKKLLEAFIRGLPRSIEGNVIASKPQTLKEAINISQRKKDAGNMSYEELVSWAEVEAQHLNTPPKPKTVSKKVWDSLTPKKNDTGACGS